MAPASSTRWWQGIVALSFFAMAAIVIILGSWASIRVGRLVMEREHDQAVIGLTELLDTVESTASIACFANDEQLAKEVAQGLLRNGDVLRVAIRAGDRVLAGAERASLVTGDSSLGIGIAGEPNDWKVVRRLKSPFNPSEVVGDVVLDADSAVIDARINQKALDAVIYLSSQMAMVVASVAVLIYLLVVRPIKAISDNLHRLDPTSGNRLKIPEGHRQTEVGRLVGDINDLADRLVDTLQQERETQRQQVIAQRKYQDLFDNAGSGIFVADREGWLDSFNRAFVDLTWIAESKTPRVHLTDTGWQEPQRLLELLRGCLEAAGESEGWEADLQLIGRRGDERWLHLALVPIGDGNVQGTVTDVTLRKREEISARRLAVTDPLTGFANRSGLQSLLSDLMPSNPPFALVMIDLDGFKQINEALGFPVGDQLLLAVAGQIRKSMAPGDIVARIGGDEFVMVMIGEFERSSIDERMVELQRLLGIPLKLNMADATSEVAISASIGIALFPADGLDLQRLLRSAELALNSAHAAGGRTYRYFDPAQQAAVEHRRRMEDDLRHALGANELHLAFQPIVDIRNRRMAGAEALLRWNQPSRGMVPPDVFIPLAEELGLIGAIGVKVVEDACSQVAEWRRNGFDLYVSINVSAKQIPDALPPELLKSCLERHQLPAKSIALEITEGALMTNMAEAQSWIEQMRGMGLRIYLDDFGTGYSSLSYLKRFPMDTVKIDKSFVRDMGGDHSDRALVSAIITMAGSLNLDVVAEGVEDERQLEILREMDCGYVQGYLFSRPVKGDDFLPIAARINASLLS
jgi:diguanylate cyclase (GGDEF)-like protein/PAS domain S-box-containing protein